MTLEFLLRKSINERVAKRRRQEHCSFYGDGFHLLEFQYARKNGRYLNGVLSFGPDCAIFFLLDEHPTYAHLKRPARHAKTTPWDLLAKVVQHTVQELLERPSGLVGSFKRCHPAVCLTQDNEHALRKYALSIAELAADY